MHRLFLTAALTATLGIACSTPFRAKRTPSGEFCSDMQVVPAGQVSEREYHRLQPVASDPEARTEAERLESLRKAACEIGGDGVIEAVNEEIRTEDGRYASVASGTAVMWVRRTTGDAKPLALPTTSASAAPEAPPAEPEAEAPPAADLYDEAAPPAASGTPAKGQPKGQPKGRPKGQPSAPSSSKPSQPAAPSSAKPSQPATPPAPKKK